MPAGPAPTIATRSLRFVLTGRGYLPGRGSPDSSDRPADQPGLPGTEVLTPVYGDDRRRPLETTTMRTRRAACPASARGCVHDDDRHVVATARDERRRDEVVGGILRVRARAQDLGDPRVVDLVRETVRAHEDPVARAERQREEVRLG